MSCGCSGLQTNGPLLTGTLDPAFSTPDTKADSNAEESILGGSTFATGKNFWEIAAIVAFVALTAWAVYSSGKKE